MYLLYFFIVLCLFSIIIGFLLGFHRSKEKIDIFIFLLKIIYYCNNIYDNNLLQYFFSSYANTSTTEL